MSKFVKINNRLVNTNHIVCIYEDEDGFYNIRMSNADFYLLEIDKKSKKLIEGIINADIQLSSERVAKRTNRDIQ